ncbi:MAG TPA: RagB/SusD family nutrient uptake outer membrane protein [Gemmatimonadaceae bacterium]|nr:RagB/SusD family nutrient uptake outer membrane protein [Gemmatimonadaceae bacterium]
MTRSIIARRPLRVALAALAALGLAACGDDLLVEAPKDIIVADNLYTNPAGFEAGLNALYAQVRKERNGYQESGDNIVGMTWSVGVDNGWANYVLISSRTMQELGSFNNPLYENYLWMWKWLYETINAANTIVNRAANPDIAWTPEERDRVIAEARLIRAWAYRHLTYLWGDVPLNLDESSGATIRTDWTRTPRAEVQRQMEEDLLFAEAHLPETSPMQGKLVKAVAQHYLAELYLAMDRPAEAQAKAEAVINSGLYSLITERYGVKASEPGVPFMDQFLDGNANRNQGNTEVLWSLQLDRDLEGGGLNIMRREWVNRYYTLRGIDITQEGYGGRGIGRISPTKWAIDLYEPGDDRGSRFAIRKFLLYNDADRLPAGKSLGDTLWLSWDEESTNDPRWPSTRKWDWINDVDPAGGYQYNDQPYLRLAETYLLLAEAQFKQNDLTGAAATLNVVRERSHATPIDAADVTLDFILDERSRELLSEEHRRYTLLRTHTWMERTRAHNPLTGPKLAARDTLLPIPQAVIDANIGTGMQQNPGY